jgi:hypothetical protein
MMGEEAIFFVSLKSQKQNIIIAPKIIAVHSAVSTDDKLEERYFVLGAFLTRVSNYNYFKGFS